MFEDAVRQMLARADNPSSAHEAVSGPTDGASGLLPGADLENKAR